MRRSIDPSLSVYFEVVRFHAAVVVMLSHIWPLLFPSMPLPWPGHAAVVVFFVLSGYVIAFAADKPGQTLEKYALHRSVRILSVTIPALLLSIAIAPIAGNTFIPHAGALEMTDAEFWKAIWLNAFFLGESWFGSIKPPFNSPFWSLSYEVWYYVVFAAWTFGRGAWRYFWVVVAAAAAGLKILVLLPVWLLGVALYRSGMELSPEKALKLFAASLIAALAFYWFNCSILIRSQLLEWWPAIKILHGSNEFAGDYILGLIVSANFLAAASLGKYLRPLLKVESPARYMASFTLSVYVFHMPLTVLIWNGIGVHSVPAFLFLLFAGIYLLGSLTERQNMFLRGRLERFIDLAPAGGGKPSINVPER